jgi:uncharacterized protein involved in outer membrane biogenesis
MRWKRIVGIAAVLFIATIVAAYVILSTYDYNKFKPRIAEVVEDATGRKLTLAGDIDLEIGLSPTLVVEDVNLALHLEGRSILEAARLLPIGDVPDLGPLKIGLRLSDVAPKT